MLNLEDLSQFVAFYKYGTLTKVAEEFLISQPTLTRNMKRIEDELGVSLFVRSANRLSFNETGIKAVQYASELLNAANQCVSNIQEFDRKLHTIIVDSCAPAPLWSFMPKVYQKQPDKTITSNLVDDIELLESNLLSHKCNVAILPHPIDIDGIICFAYLEEHLSICVPPDHELAKYDSVSTAQINGFNCLLSSDIGFWNNFHKQSLPNSKFYVQTDEEAFKELVKETSLPCFTTDLATDYYEDNLGNRITVPITDEAANVTYYVCYWKGDVIL